MGIKKRYSLLMMGIALSMTAGPALATSVEVFTDDSNPVPANELASYQTTGETMEGMEITIDFFDGTSQTETVVWDGDTLGADGDGWTLTLVDFDESTYYGTQWILDIDDDQTDMIITELTIDAYVGGVVFDIWDTPEGTPGSEYGAPFQLQAGSYGEESSELGDLDVTYSNPVGIYSNDPVGDLYGSLTIEFDSGAGYFNSTDSLYFFADTDDIAGVPEPATMLLFGTGLAALGGGALRKRKK